MARQKTTITTVAFLAALKKRFGKSAFTAKQVERACIPGITKYSIEKYLRLLHEERYLHHTEGALAGWEFTIQESLISCPCCEQRQREWKFSDEGTVSTDTRRDVRDALFFKERIAGTLYAEKIDALFQELHGFAEAGRALRKNAR